MKTSIFFQFLLLLLIVLINIQPQVFPIQISPLPATIALAMLVLVHTYIKLRPAAFINVAPVDTEEKDGKANHGDKNGGDVAPPVTEIVNDFKSLSDLLEAAKSSSSDEETLQQLQLEYDIYRQCYIWVENMEKTYGKQWRDTIQGADMPVKPDIFPKIHRLMAEVAMHTIDFCRYRTSYINLTPPMKVNPTMILLHKDAEQAGAKPYSDDPYETEREVRVLHALLQNDGVELQNATIHGYYEATPQETKQ